MNKISTAPNKQNSLCQDIIWINSRGDRQRVNMGMTVAENKQAYTDLKKFCEQVLQDLDSYYE